MTRLSETLIYPATFWCQVSFHPQISSNKVQLENYSATYNKISSSHSSSQACQVLQGYRANLIPQILQYTDVPQDRSSIEQALLIAESILGHINESIREQEGRERLKTISQDLWVGQG
jgi:hypothetical protein